MILSKKLAFSLGVVLILFIIMAFMGSKKISPLGLMLWGQMNADSGLALKGYDTVAYQTQGAAIRGNKAFQHQWKGVTWYFSNEEHKSLFENEPERYAPQYANYCSYAVSQGVTADIDPTVWHVQYGKVYLFMDIGVKQQWIDSDAVLISDKNWNM